MSQRDYALVPLDDLGQRAVVSVALGVLVRVDHTTHGVAELYATVSKLISARK